MSKKLPGEKIVEIRYSDKKDILTVAVNPEALELMPQAIAQLLGIVIKEIHERGTDYIELMGTCKMILSNAWEANGIKFEPVELIDESDDPRRDRKEL